MSEILHGSCLCKEVRFEVDPALLRAFCEHCGSSLFGGNWPDGPLVSIRLGAFDTDPCISPEFRTFVDSAALWDRFDDDVPRYSGEWTAQATPDR